MQDCHLKLNGYNHYDSLCELNDDLIDSCFLISKHNWGHETSKSSSINNHKTGDIHLLSPETDYDSIITAKSSNSIFKITY